MTASNSPLQQLDHETIRKKLSVLACGLPTELPPRADRLQRDGSVPHAPVIDINRILTPQEQKQAIKNALRYFPREWHTELAEDFKYELQTYGHIWMYRFRPRAQDINDGYDMKAYPIELYPAKSQQAAAIMLMIMNNLDPEVAQYPHELVTYGGNGSVFNNWAQYILTMKYLSQMTDEQTLVMASGHPQGLFPAFRDSPRCIVTNGMVIPNFSTPEDYARGYALGVTQYGQMTAGSYCYIGPQGIVHGTTLTVLNAGRKYLNLDGAKEMAGKVFVTSGLGGMSGAQAKAGPIVGCVTIVAEINPAALDKRHKQGWLMEKITDLESCIQRIRKARQDKEAISIGFLGNIVDLWERLAQEEEMLVELGSDQTSCHNAYGGGYYPAGLTYEESNALMKNDPEAFKTAVQASLKRHIAAINKLAARGLRFFDYGNSFLAESARVGADVVDKNRPSGFKYPSYVEDIMGDIFSLGFGPFRWVCLSGDAADLRETDRIAAEVIDRLRKDAPTKSRQQFDDNYMWVVKAEENKLVVGSQARILYSDALGRREISLAFNEAIRTGKLHGPVVLSRDHHDVSGADSPYRETSNIYDGSNKTADMAVHTVLGNAARGATWVALHNGGGTGWGWAINCGFGLVLDGTEDAARRASMMLWWDVNNGICRRAWSGNNNANETLTRAMEHDSQLKCTVPVFADDSLIDSLF